MHFHTYMLAAALLALLFHFGDSHASEERPGTWTEVEIKAALPKPHREIKVGASIDQSDVHKRLKSISVQMDGRAISVPNKAYSDLKQPSLRSLDVTYDGGKTTDEDWRLYIRISYLPVENCDWAHAGIMINGEGRVTGRILQVFTSGVAEVAIENYSNDGT